MRAADLARWLGGYPRIVRAMPNTPALVGAGISGAFAGPAVAAHQRALAARVLEAAGEVVWVEREEMLDAVTGVSGSGPAYVFYFLEALEEAARAVGFGARRRTAPRLRDVRGGAQARAGDRPRSGHAARAGHVEGRHHRARAGRARSRGREGHHRRRGARGRRARARAGRHARPRRVALSRSDRNPTLRSWLTRRSSTCSTSSSGSSPMRCCCASRCSSCAHRSATRWGRR